MYVSICRKFTISDQCGKGPYSKTAQWTSKNLKQGTFTITYGYYKSYVRVLNEHTKSLIFKVTYHPSPYLVT